MSLSDLKFQWREGDVYLSLLQFKVPLPPSLQVDLFLILIQDGALSQTGIRAIMEGEKI